MVSDFETCNGCNGRCQPWRRLVIVTQKVLIFQIEQITQNIFMSPWLLFSASENYGDKDCFGFYSKGLLINNECLCLLSFFLFVVLVLIFCLYYSKRERPQRSGFQILK